MEEKLPLYLLAHQEDKPLTELLFWYEFQLGRFILAVLADQPENWVYPMALVFPEDGTIYQIFSMPATILAQLASEEEVSEQAIKAVAKMRDQF